MFLRKNAAKHHIAGAVVLLGFCVFALCILLVLLTGARSYRGLAARDSASYSRNIAARYVAAKIRHADMADSIFVGDFSGENQTAEKGTTLFLAEKDGGRTYYTRIYCYKGFVRELYAPASDSFQPADGDTVLAAEELRFRLERNTGLLTVYSTDRGGQTAEVTLSFRSREVAG